MTKRTEPAPAVDSSDVLMFLGVLLVAVATALISIPVAIGFVGVVLIVVGIMQAWKG